MKNNHLISTAVLCLTVFSLSDSFAQKNWKPLEKYDFTSHEWQFVYTEKVDNDTGATWKYWIIDDTRTIDSLKSEFKADYDMQCDGFREYYFHLFKDKYEIKGTKHQDRIAIYGNKKYFSLGKLKNALIPVQKTDIDCPNLNSLNTLIDSLNKYRIIYTIQRTDTTNKEATEFCISLDLLLRYESKLISESKSSSLDNIETVVQELERLYPEIKKESIKAESIGGNLHFLARINSDKFFKFDISRLSQTDLFRQYKIKPSHIVTSYSKI